MWSCSLGSVLLIIGCTAGSGGGTAELSAGEESRVLSQLDTQGLDDLCAWVTTVEASDRYLEHHCSLSAVLALGITDPPSPERQAECEAARDECIRNFGNRHFSCEPEAASMPQLALEELTQCDATVGELKRCVLDTAAGVPEFIRCAAPKLSDDARLWAASCEVLESKCGTEVEPEPATESAVTAACRATCERHAIACGRSVQDECGACGVLGDLSTPEACIETALAAFNCDDAANLACDATDFYGTPTHCAADLLVCQKLGAPGCGRDEEYDELLCTSPEFPHGYRCVSTSAEAQACEYKGGLAYCCRP